MTAACPFCEIVSGRAAATRVAERGDCLAILDLHPVRPGHALVIPCVHAPTLGELTAETADRLFRLGRELAAAQRAAGMGEGTTYLLLDGPGSSQHVAHAHLHVVPRRRGDLLPVVGRFVVRMLLDRFGPPRSPEERERQADRIRSFLARPASPAPPAPRVG